MMQNFPSWKGCTETSVFASQQGQAANTQMCTSASNSETHGDEQEKKGCGTRREGAQEAKVRRKGTMLADRKTTSADKG